MYSQPAFRLEGSCNTIKRESDNLQDAAFSGLILGTPWGLGPPNAAGLFESTWGERERCGLRVILTNTCNMSLPNSCKVLHPTVGKHTIAYHWWPKGLLLNHQSSDPFCIILLQFLVWASETYLRMDLGQHSINLIIMPVITYNPQQNLDDSAQNNPQQYPTTCLFPWTSASHHRRNSWMPWRMEFCRATNASERWRFGAVRWLGLGRFRCCNPFPPPAPTCSNHICICVLFIYTYYELCIAIYLFNTVFIYIYRL